MRKFIILLILIILAVFIFFGLKDKDRPEYLNSETDGLILDSPTNGRTALLPIFVTGSVKKDGNWRFGEGKAGEVQLFDDKDRAVSDIFSLVIVSDSESGVIFRTFLKPNTEIKTSAGYLVLNEFALEGMELKTRRVDLNLAQGEQFIPVGEPFSIPQAVIMPVQGLDRLGITFLGATTRKDGLILDRKSNEPNTHMSFSIFDAETKANEDGTVLATPVDIIIGQTKIVKTAAGTISIYAIAEGSGGAAIEINLVK